MTQDLKISLTERDALARAIHESYSFHLGDKWRDDGDDVHLAAWQWWSDSLKAAIDILQSLKPAAQVAAPEAGIVHPVPVSGEGVPKHEQERGSMCLPDGVMFDYLGNPRVRYVRVIHDGSTAVVPPGDVAAMVDEENATDYRTEDVYLSKEEFDALPEFDGF